MAKKSARARARELVQKIERAIERGEFVPEYGIGDPGIPTEIFGGAPCGCARAAASAVLGGLHYYPKGLSRVQRLSLEYGYEGIQSTYAANNKHFLKAGRELRKFHPETTAVPEVLPRMRLVEGATEYAAVEAEARRADQ